MNPSTLENTGNSQALRRRQARPCWLSTIANRTPWQRRRDTSKQTKCFHWPFTTCPWSPGYVSCEPPRLESCCQSPVRLQEPLRFDQNLHWEPLSVKIVRQLARMWSRPSDTWNRRNVRIRRAVIELGGVWTSAGALLSIGKK